MWWYVARFKAGLPKVARGVEIVFGQVPYSDEFFSPGDEVWMKKEEDGRWLCVQPIPGGRQVLMTQEACKRYLQPAEPPMPPRVVIETSDATS
jgi:hypothetical protein